MKVEQPGHEADHLLVSSVKVKNVQRFTTTASVVSCCGASFDTGQFYLNLLSNALNDR